MAGFCGRLAIVPGEEMSAKTRWSSSQTVVVPLGERLGVPSGQTVATKPNFCLCTNSLISVVKMPIEEGLQSCKSNATCKLLLLRIFFIFQSNLHLKRINNIL